MAKDDIVITHTQGDDFVVFFERPQPPRRNHITGVPHRLEKEDPELYAKELARTERESAEEKARYSRVYSAYALRYSEVDDAYYGLRDRLVKQPVYLGANKAGFVHGAFSSCSKSDCVSWRRRYNLDDLDIPKEPKYPDELDQHHHYRHHRPQFWAHVAYTDIHGEKSTMRKAVHTVEEADPESAKEQAATEARNDTLLKQYNDAHAEYTRALKAPATTPCNDHCAVDEDTGTCLRQESRESSVSDQWLRTVLSSRIVL